MTLGIYFLIALIVFILKIYNVLNVFHKSNPWMLDIPIVGEFLLSVIGGALVAIFWPLTVVYMLVYGFCFFLTRHKKLQTHESIGERNRKISERISAEVEENK